MAKTAEEKAADKAAKEKAAAEAEEARHAALSQEERDAEDAAAAAKAPKPKYRRPNHGQVSRPRGKGSGAHFLQGGSRRQVRRARRGVQGEPEQRYRHGVAKLQGPASRQAPTSGTAALPAPAALLGNVYRWTHKHLSLGGGHKTHRMEDEIHYPILIHRARSRKNPQRSHQRRKLLKKRLPRRKRPEGDTPKPDEEKPSEAEKPVHEHVTVEQADQRAVNLPKREGAVAVASPRPANRGCRRDNSRFAGSGQRFDQVWQNPNPQRPVRDYFHTTSGCHGFFCCPIQNEGMSEPIGGRCGPVARRADAGRNDQSTDGGNYRTSL